MNSNISPSINNEIAIIGSGIIGLASALWLQQAGFKVTIIDRNEPGMGTSYGNAGVLASFARLPFTRFSMLCKIPGMLIDPNSPLSIARHYIPELTSYGWNYFKSCFRYKSMRHALTELQTEVFEADQQLLNLTGAQDLIRSTGSLGLFATPSSFEKAKRGEMKERKQQGVNIEFCDANKVHELEPGLKKFYAGGVYYPDTRFTISPLELSQRYAAYFEKNGGKFIRESVHFINSSAQKVEIQTTLKRLNFDHLVIAAGVGSKQLTQQLGFKIPLVCERGYHLTIDTEDKHLTRPVAWLDNSVFISPMSDGIRLAGTAEFANENAPPNQGRIESIKRHAKTMLGDDIQFNSSWLGSRPSTPDSLPIIGPLPEHPRVTLAFGHGHLGLTLSAITGKLVAETIQNIPTSVDLTDFSPSRFN